MTYWLRFAARPGWLTLNRPTRLNAFTWDLRDEMLSALQSPGASASEAIILTGAGRAFCAGVDLDVFYLASRVRRRKHVEIS
jgi:enoyl-CoA hydratase/carnithine racemase